MRNNPECELSQASWRKSTYSGASGGDCLEVGLTEGHPSLVPVRDSKNLGPSITFGAAAWTAFVGHVGATG
ncbi:DUF397 domain-containing protein [Streptomyces sp. NPDC005281]|uniref:DUF397 domain-containing protein n=1 Tax=Streptomyces sp. NPDC005281 TaxID=3155712 RepID=UPI0033AD5C28